APDEYQTLHQVLQSILLLAIAGELALLLLFHRATAAVEVVMFVIARRMVATDVTDFDLLMGSAALAALMAVRFYFLPGKPKQHCDTHFKPFLTHVHEGIASDHGFFGPVSMTASQRLRYRQCCAIPRTFGQTPQFTDGLIS